MDNVFIEWLWRSPKYDCVYLRALETGSELRGGVGQWITYYNTQRANSGLARRPPGSRPIGGSGNQYMRGHAERPRASSRRPSPTSPTDVPSSACLRTETICAAETFVRFIDISIPFDHREISSSK